MWRRALGDQIRYSVPFFQVPDEIVKQPGTTVYHIAVFAVLAMHAGKDLRAWPSYSRIANLCGCSRKKAMDTVSELAEMGWLTVERRRKEGASENASNLYHLQPSLQGGVPDTPGVVSEVHQGGVPRTPEPYPMNHTQENHTGDCAPEVVSGRRITDAFQAKFVDAYGKKPTWTQTAIHQARHLGNKHPAEEIAMAMRVYFEREHWFTRGGRSWAQFHRHYDEIASVAPDARPKSEEKRVMGMTLREILSG